tara:strand:+ start:1050 stop:1325 length:276 start_codon:yes stop_codon:yes gene_type:complete
MFTETLLGLFVLSVLGGAFVYFLVMYNDKIKSNLKISEKRFWNKSAQMELPFGKRKTINYLGGKRKRNQMINEGIANRVKKARTRKPRKTK